MATDLARYTRCAAPGEEMPFPLVPLLATFLAVGGITGVILWFAAKEAQGAVPCGVLVLAACIGLITALHYVRRWYYEWRLMCVRKEQCAIGTLVGAPIEACDGDRKLDLLIAPFGFREADVTMMSGAVQAVVASEPGFPAPPADLETNRDARVAYVEGLTKAQRKRVYQEVVHNDMLDPVRNPGRQSQSRYYRREAPPVMPQDAFDRTPTDVVGDPDANPMFKYVDPSTGGPDLSSRFCDIVLAFEEEHEPTRRLVPFLHTEIEGNRIDVGVAALQAAIFMLAVSYLIICGICASLGLPPVACAPIAAVLSLLLFVLFFLLFRWLFGVDDAGAGEAPLDVPDPNATDPTTTAAAGDVIGVFGDWIKDVEHEEYFEIHPVTAYYLICRDPAGVPEPTHDVSQQCELDVTTLTADEVETFCDLITDAERGEPAVEIVLRTSAALSVSGGVE